MIWDVTIYNLTFQYTAAAGIKSERLLNLDCLIYTLMNFPIFGAMFLKTENIFFLNKLNKKLTSNLKAIYPMMIYQNLKN